MKFLVPTLLAAFSFTAMAQKVDYSTINTNYSVWKNNVLYTLENHLRNGTVECSGKHNLRNMLLEFHQVATFTQYTRIGIEQKENHILLEVDYNGPIFTEFSNAGNRHLFNFVLSADAKEVKSFVYQKGTFSEDHINFSLRREIEDNILLPVGETTLGTLEMDKDTTTCIVTKK